MSSSVSLPDTHNESISIPFPPVHSADRLSAKSSVGPANRPKLLCLADVTPLDTHWLWKDYLPKGAIVDFVGDAGLGKSQLMVDLAARISRGDQAPLGPSDSAFERRDVLFLAAEDDPARTIRPRLDAAGADAARIHLLQATLQGHSGSELAVSLSDDIEMIEQVVRDRNVSLVVVDPYEAYVGRKLNTNSNTDNRSCLLPLARMAERTGATVVLIQHLNKKEGQRAIYRAAGSVAIVASSRAAYAVAVDPNDPAQRVFACIKCNLGPMPPALTFSIEPYGRSSRIDWKGTSDATASEILGAPKVSGGKLAQAQEIIRDALAAGPCSEREVQEICCREGISKSTYVRARRSLNVQSSKTGFDGAWILSLPNPDQSRNQPCPDDDFPL